MPISILVNGAFGKMGRLCVQTLRQHSDFSVVAECGRLDDLAIQLNKHRPDVVLDLTVASVALKNLVIIVAEGIRPIIGTSGLSEAKIEQAQKICQQQKLGGIVVPNFSIGAILLMRFAAQAAAYFDSAEIIEMHHPLKVDAPSGTAIKTAELLSANGHFSMPSPLAGAAAARGDVHQGVAIHSLRMQGVLAKQQVLLGNPGEQLMLEHSVIDRSAYMPGVLLSCRKVMALDQLIYGLETLIV